MEAELLAAISRWVGLVWTAAAISVVLLMPYVALRREANGEDWKTAIMHAYLPWLATALVILGVFGIG